MKNIYKSIVCVILVVLTLVLSGCTKAVTNPADELTGSKWYSKLENKNEITLEFIDDKARLTLSLSDKKSTTICGLCELSDTAFVIHDEYTKIPFAFSYIVHFDRVEIIYDKNTVSLYKS